MNIVRLLIYNS